MSLENETNNPREDVPVQQADEVIAQNALAEDAAAPAEKKRSLSAFSIIAAFFTVCIIGLSLYVVAAALFPSLSIGGDKALAAKDTAFADADSYALKINDTYYSAAQVNYEYMGIFQQYSQYGMYFGSVLPDDPYTMDESGEYATWGDFYMAQTKEKLQQLTALVDMAYRDNVKLDENELKEIDTWIDSLRESAATLSDGDFDAFLSENFGEGVTEEILRDMAGRESLAMKYVQWYQDHIEVSQEQLDAEYASDKDSYDSYSFRYYMVMAESEDGIPTDEALAAAQTKAEDILAKYNAGSGEPSEKLTAAIGAEEGAESAEMDGATLSQYQVPFEAWMKDPDRKSGDVDIFEQPGYGWFVILFEGRERNDTPTVSVRHILVQAADADGDGVCSDAELAEAKAQIEQIKAEWDGGEQTEERFGELANQYSSDPGSNTNGGLYENIYEGQMVPEFNDFCFDPDRKPGDVSIVEDKTYNGWHLMYFVGKGEPYTNLVLREGLIEKTMNDFAENLTKDVKVTEGSELAKVGLSAKLLESLQAQYTMTDPYSGSSVEPAEGSEP